MVEFIFIFIIPYLIKEKDSLERLEGALLAILIFCVLFIIIIILIIEARRKNQRAKKEI